MILLDYNVIIFPKLTYQVMQACPSLTVVDKRIAGRRLVSLLMNANVCRDSKELPDISIYYIKDKKWKDLYVPTHSTRKIRTVKESYMYWPLIMSGGGLSLALSYLMSYSDAEMTFSESSQQIPSFSEYCNEVEGERKYSTK